MTLPVVPDAPKSPEILALEQRDAAIDAKVTALAARVTTLEQRPPSTPGTPGAVTRITIPSALEAAIAAVPVNGVIIFQGPAAEFVAERR